MCKFNKFEDVNNFKWKFLKEAEYCGKYDMVKLAPYTSEKMPKNLLAFHELSASKELSQVWFHFYIDDYHFERLWNCPEKYVDRLTSCDGGFSTDFSMLLDMPRSQQIWNCWRNRVMAYWMQKQGIDVIPNVGWSDENSLEWAFDGIPEKSVLSITTQGCLRDYVCKQSLVNGLHRLIREKNPLKIIVYGKFPDEWKNRFSVPIVSYMSFSEMKWGDGNGQR